MGSKDQKGAQKVAVREPKANKLLQNLALTNLMSKGFFPS